MALDQRADFDALVAELEALPHIQGRRIADIPELAGIRIGARRSFYRQANASIFLAIFNAWLAFAPDFDLWPLSALGLAAATWTVAFAESRARAMSRQLHRRASEQMARDMFGIRD